MGGASALGIPASAAGAPPITPAAAPGLMTSSPYVQPWVPDAAGTPPPGGYDQRAPNPTSVVAPDTTAVPGLVQGKAVVPADDFSNTWARVKEPAWKQVAQAATAGTRNQVGPARFVNGTWTTFPSNHPDAPDYTGQNPGDWAAYGPQRYVPTGQKAKYKGQATSKKKVK